MVSLFSARGGAVYYQSGGSLSLTNCVFWANSCFGPLTEDGTALHTTAVKTYMTNCTVVRNVAVNEAVNSSAVYWGVCGPVCGSHSMDGLLKAENSIIALNKQGLTQTDDGINLRFGGDENAALQQAYFSHTCIYPYQSMLELLFTESFPSVMAVDPQLATGAEDTGYLYLDRMSVLIDAGNDYVDIDPVTPGIQFLPEVDLAGQPRFVDGNGDGQATVDIGAYEYQDSGY